ncbi:MAG TPA: hypothetical protein VND93_07085 [Myxococcales bacterium]|nr:hypothetical protein [Myxococcales bacterium]
MGDALVDRLRLKFPELTRRLEGQPRDVVRAELPFYRRHALVTLTIQTPLPQVLYFLDDGVQLYTLLGDADLAAANARERLQLVPQHAEAYARFALRHGLRVEPVERPDHLLWYSDADENPELRERKEAAIRALRPLRVVMSPEGGFEVTAVIRAGRSLSEHRYRLTLGGVLERRGQQVVAEDVPASAPMR